MRSSRSMPFACAAVSALLATAFAGDARAAGPLAVLYAFTGGSDGGNAATSLAFDQAGTGYGTTVIGGTSNCGTIFRLTNAGGQSKETVLYNFSCFADGKNPHGGVTLDAAGNLYGTTVAGGSGGTCAGDGCGTVFELTSKGERVLHSFRGGRDGFGAGGPVAFGPGGTLYGTTPDGGVHGMGTVYEITRLGARARERVIHAFTGGSDGAVGSLGPLLVDTAGRLYGVTEIGGAHSAGTVFRMTPDAKGGWDFRTLYAFAGQPDAGSPYGGLIADAHGNLYGTTYYGGANGLGTIFELTPGARGTYVEHVLYSFRGGRDGSSPTSTLVPDAAGNLYATTSAGGGTCGCGAVVELLATTGAERVRHRFSSGTDGAYPYYGLTAGPDGLFGATVAGGSNGQGTIFRLDR